MNSVFDLAKFFGTEERPMEVREFNEFWSSLTEAEKAYYRTAKLN